MTDIIAHIKKWNDLTVIDNNLCRLCMSLTDFLIPIFEGEGIEQKLCEKIKKYLPVDISSSDALPQQICYLCAGTLIAWDSLYVTCVRTDLNFKSYLIKNDTIDKEVDSEDEPLIYSKKRQMVISSEWEKKGSQTDCEKSKRKIFASKDISKSGEKMSDVKEKDSEEHKEKKDLEGNWFHIIKNDGADKKDVIIKIKTECDVGEEKEKTVDDNSANKETDLITESCSVKCEFCNKSYKEKRYLSRHIKKFHDKAKSLKVQRCDHCGNIYKTKANLEKHYFKEHLTNQVPCPVCHTSFNSKKLDFHLKSVHGVKTETVNKEKFKCKMCDKWFKNKYVRNSHVKEVHLSEPMKCKLCDFEGVRTVLRRHKRDVHAEKRFLCSLCPGAFKTLHTLKMHMTSHSDIRCYTCDICGMGFKRLNNVRDHMKCHEQKSNQCQICGNFFARKRYLAIHEKTIHNFYADGVIPEEKGFECGTCGAKLKWKKNLLAHMRIHTGEKPYVCKICNKDFICHGSLRTHMAKHSVCILNEGVVQNHLSVEVNMFNNFNPDQF